MRRPFIAGNWKMNLTLAEAEQLSRGIAEQAGRFAAVDVAVCPPSVYLSPVSACLSGSSVGLGAQNIYHESSGAYTGEISAAMIKDVGCAYVILGHSERRHLMGECDEAVNKKLHAALAGGLTPIVCVGETLDQRQANETAQVIATQFKGSLAGLTADQAKSIVIAYEPVWAIGTGQVATPEQAQEVHAQIRGLLRDAHGADVADAVRLQYGGSVKPDNAATLLSQTDIDGALVGGAALKTDSFLGIIEAANS